MRHAFSSIRVFDSLEPQCDLDVIADNARSRKT